MAWLQLSVTTDEQSAPALADFFSNLGAISVTYMDAEDEPVYEPAIGETKIWSNTQVIALYDFLNVDLTAIQQKSRNLLPQAPLKNWLLEEIADQPWELAWLEHYHPMKFAERLWVCPTGQEQHEPGTSCLILDPGLAFGTGTHPTTALCLEWLAEQDLTHKKVIDYGCGSGILAVAAVLLGARNADAIDIDPQALTATVNNAEKNHVLNQIHPYLPTAYDFTQQADVIIANILAKPLIDMAATLTSLLAPQATLVLSGILAEQAEAVKTAYSPYINVTGIKQQEDWVRLVGIRL